MHVVETFANDQSKIYFQVNTPACPPDAREVHLHLMKKHVDCSPASHIDAVLYLIKTLWN